MPRRNRYNNNEDTRDVYTGRRSNKRGKYKEQQAIETQDKVEHKKKSLNIIPRNLSQKYYLEALKDPNKYIVFGEGEAGTGKTLLATQIAIKNLLDKQIEKIILTRPAVSVDEAHGFLPGGLLEKMAPWVRPIIDVFREVYSKQEVERMLQNEIIEIAPLAYMRGRTFKNSIIIFDEAQNSTVSQMKMVLTRLGEGSRIFITGDTKQHDRGFDKSGLHDFMNRLTIDSASISLVRFSSKDVVRHPVIEELLYLYEGNLE